MIIETVKDFNTARAQMPYAWPGGYPLYAVTSDGGALCPTCFETERYSIGHSIHHDIPDGWKVEAVEINYEAAITCDHCGEAIEAAYEVPEC